MWWGDLPATCEGRGKKVLKQWMSKVVKRSPVMFVGIYGLWLQWFCKGGALDCKASKAMDLKKGISSEQTLTLFVSACGSTES